MVTLCMALWTSQSVQADNHLNPLEVPTGPVVLTITGKIQNTNIYGQADFDLTMLHALAPTRIVTSTPWTEGTITFDGVSLETLMNSVAAKGTEGEFAALNDYTVRFDINDAIKNHAIIAYLQNNKNLRVREMGPLWLIFPMDDDPKLRTMTYRDRMVWQLRTIDVK